MGMVLRDFSDRVLQSLKSWTQLARLLSRRKNRLPWRLFRCQVGDRNSCSLEHPVKHLYQQQIRTIWIIELYMKILSKSDI